MTVGDRDVRRSPSLRLQRAHDLVAYREQQLASARDAGRSPRYIAERRRLLDRAIAWRDSARRAVERRSGLDGSERTYQRSPAAWARRYAKRIAQLETRLRDARGPLERARLEGAREQAERRLAVALRELRGQPAAHPTPGGQPVGTILSTAAVALLAAREVRERREPVSVDELLAYLDRLGVEADRAQAGVQRAVATGHLMTVVDDAERHCVRPRTAFDIAADLIDPAGARAAA